MSVGGSATIGAFIVGEDFGDGQTGRASRWFKRGLEVTRRPEFTLTAVPRDLRDGLASQRANEFGGFAIRRAYRT